MMKHILIFLTTLLCCLSGLVKADSFFDDLILDKQQKLEVQEKMLMDESKAKTSEALDRRLLNLKFKQKKQEIEEPDVVFDIAPFGLLWLAPKKEIEKLNVTLRPKPIKDAPNCFATKHLPKPVSAFENVLICFGKNDALWRIVAYGVPTDDNEKASKGLEEYQKFYDIFKDKYGNDQEFYTAAVVNIDEEVALKDGSTSHVIKQRFVEKGDDDFKQKLMNGESILYATFHNLLVEVTLVLTANGDGQTFIVVDYQNLRKTSIEQQQMLDAL